MSNKSVVVILVAIVAWLYVNTADAGYMPTAAQLSAMDRLLGTSIAKETCSNECIPWLVTPGIPFTTGQIAHYSRVDGESVWGFEEWLCDVKADTCLRLGFDFGEHVVLGNIHLFQMSTKQLLLIAKENERMSPTDQGAIVSSERAWDLLMRLGLPT